jgi:Double zinc ribbon
MTAAGVNCAKCGASVVATQRFCGVCGQPVAPTSKPAPALSSPCANCGGAVPAGSKFCGTCGHAVTGAPGISSAPAVPRSAAASALTAAPASGAAAIGPPSREPNALVAAAITFGACAVVSALGWRLLTVPSSLIQITPTYCNSKNLTPGTAEMYRCSMGVAFQTMIGPLVAAGVALFGVLAMRVPIGQYILRLRPELRFLVTPLLTTGVFGLLWSGMHSVTAGQSGLLPQTIFPAIVGVFAFAAARFGPEVQKIASGFFAARDQFPAPLRAIVALAIPFLLSLVITNQERVTDTARKEQVVVLVTLVTSYFALAPRTRSSTRGTLPRQDVR